MKDIIDLIVDGKREKGSDGIERIVDECGIAYPKELLKEKLRSSEVITTLVDSLPTAEPKVKTVSTNTAKLQIRDLVNIKLNRSRGYTDEQIMKKCGKSKQVINDVVVGNYDYLLGDYYSERPLVHSLPDELQATTARIRKHIADGWIMDKVCVHYPKQFPNRGVLERWCIVTGSKFSKAGRIQGDITPAERVQIINQYKQGDTENQLIVRFNRSRHTIRNICAEVELPREAAEQPPFHDSVEQIDSPAFVEECRKYFVDEGWVTDKILLHFPERFPDRSAWREFAAKHNLSRPAGLHRRLGSVEEQEIIKHYQIEGMTEGAIVYKFNRSRECVRPLLVRTTAPSQEEVKATNPFWTHQQMF